MISYLIIGNGFVEVVCTEKKPFKNNVFGYSMEGIELGGAFSNWAIISLSVSFLGLFSSNVILSISSSKNPPKSAVFSS